MSYATQKFIACAGNVSQSCDMLEDEYDLTAGLPYI